MMIGNSVIWCDLRPNLPVAESFCISENELVMLMFRELISTLKCHEICLRGKGKLNALNERWPLESASPLARPPLLHD